MTLFVDIVKIIHKMSFFFLFKQNSSADTSLSTRDNPTIYDLELKCEWLSTTSLISEKKIEYITKVTHMSIVLRFWVKMWCEI
jgi:hypothetical protein